MKIIVCIKQVPAQTDVRVDQATGQLKTEAVSWVVNPWDEYAIEEAVRIKEKLPGSTVTAVCLGTAASEAALRDAMAVGVDEGVLLCDGAFENADSIKTARVLAAGIKKLKDYGLVLCGRISTDASAGQVGPSLAEMLDIPHISFVKKTEEIAEQSGKFQRTTEEGYDLLESGFPLLITVVKEINEPRIPSLKGKMAAKKAVITRWTAKDLDIATAALSDPKGSPTVVLKQQAPPPRPRGEALAGSLQEKATSLVKKLRESGFL